MKTPVYRTPTALGTFLAAGLLLGGCNTLAQRAVPVELPGCELAAGQPLEAAFEEARALLASAACRDRFGEIDAALLARASENPGAENLQRFYAFYSDSAARGVITQREAQGYYSRRFTDSYGASLPDGHSNCATGEARLAGVLEALRDEAEEKRRGQLEILDDRDAWFRAKRRHDDLVLVLETTQLACRDRT